MAGETTRSSVTELVLAKVVERLILHYQWNMVIFLAFFRFRNMMGDPSNVASFPRWVKDAASDIPNETTELTPVELETTAVDVTVARVGIAREVSEEALEDTVIGRAMFMAEIVEDAGRLLGEAAEEDGAAEFANATNSVTDSGNPLDVPDLVSAMGKQRAAKVRGPQVFALGDVQLEDLQQDQESGTGTAWNQFFTPNVDGSEFGGWVMGTPVFSSGLNPSANTTDVVGCLFAQGQAAPRYAAFAYAVKRNPVTKMDSKILKDSEQTATIARYGVGTIAPNFATKIVTVGS